MTTGKPMLRKEAERAIRAGRRAQDLDQSYKIPSPEEFRVWLQSSRRATTPAISQRELAALAGVHRFTVAAIEQGRKEPTLRVAHELWRVMHAAHAGRLWVGVQVRRDNQALRVIPRDGEREADLLPPKIRLRKMRADPPRPAVKTAQKQVRKKG